MSTHTLVGHVLGHYQLTELLGMGGMGAVYRAHQQSLNREVAIKVLEPSLASESGYLERFNREAQVAASLEHPNIVPVYDYGTQDGFSYVAMRLFHGGSLADRINQQPDGAGPLAPLPQIARMLSQLASALDYAHKRGVIHRDIKPGNVMFDEQGRPYLVDFGIAKLLEASTLLTQSGQIMGTPAYMPPEQWLDEPITPASDQYALAILVYQMATGHLPFYAEGGGPYAMMNKHMHETPKPMRDWRPDVPEAVDWTIRRAMAKQPSDRYPTVTAFAQAFARAVKEGESLLPSQGTPTIVLPPTSEAAPPTPPSAATAPLTKPPRRRWLGCSFLVTVGVLALAAFLFASAQQESGAVLPTQVVLNTAAPSSTVTATATQTPTTTPELTETAAAAETARAEQDLTLTAQAWTPVPDRFQYELWGQSGAIRSLAYNPDGSLLASGSDDASISLWETGTGQQLSSLTGHSGAVRSLAFYPDSSVLASASEDGTIGMWDVYGGASFGYLEGHAAAVTGVTFTPDGGWLASSGDDGHVRLWDMATWGEIAALPGYGAAMKCVAFGPDGTLLAAGGEDGNVFIWQAADLSAAPVSMLGHSAAVNNLAFSPDGAYLASASDDGTVIVWDMASLSAANAFSGSAMRTVAFGPAGDLLAGAGDDGVVWLWEVGSWAELAQLWGYGQTVWDVAISPDGGTLASGNQDTRVIFWGVYG
jgi:serine/threonine protein kinase